MRRIYIHWSSAVCWPGSTCARKGQPHGHKTGRARPFYSLQRARAFRCDFGCKMLTRGFLFSCHLGLWLQRDVVHTCSSRLYTHGRGRELNCTNHMFLSSCVESCYFRPFCAPVQQQFVVLRSTLRKSHVLMSQPEMRAAFMARQLQSHMHTRTRTCIAVRCDV